MTEQRLTDEQIKDIARSHGMVEEYWQTNPPKFGACWMTPDGFVNAVRAILSADRGEPVAWRHKERVNGEFDSDWILTKAEPPNGVRVIAKEALYAAAPSTPQPAPDFDAARDEIECFRAVCKAVNETPVLASMLYDLDLMPEQTMCEQTQWSRTVRVVGAVMDHLPALATPQPDTVQVPK